MPRRLFCDFKLEINKLAASKGWTFDEAVVQLTAYYDGYHFFSPTASVEDQFKNLTSTVDLSTQDLIPIIDVENRGRGSLDEFCNRLRKFLIDVENHYKVKPIIYTSSHFYNKYLRGKFTEYKYMIARYHDEEPVLADNIQFVMWQFTSEGRISGIKGPVDRSKFMDGYSMIDILIR